MLHEPERASQFMPCSLPEQRRFARVQVPISATVICPELGDESHVALVEDLNILGAFLYCNLDIQLDQTVIVRFMFPDGSRTLVCEAVVVRVERPNPTGPAGIAVQLVRYDLERQAFHAGLSSAIEDSAKPFIGWTVEMVEQLFHAQAEVQRRY